MCKYVLCIAFITCFAQDLDVIQVMYCSLEQNIVCQTHKNHIKNHKQIFSSENIVMQNMNLICMKAYCIRIDMDTGEGAYRRFLVCLVMPKRLHKRIFVQKFGPVPTRLFL